MTPGHASNAVRLALAKPTLERLDLGLHTLAALLNARRMMPTRPGDDAPSQLEQVADALGQAWDCHRGAGRRS